MSESPVTTIGQRWPLQSGSTNAPLLNPGAQTTFQFQDVPDRSPTGPLAYYLPGVELTFSGSIVQGSEGAQSIYSDEFYGALFTSLQWVQAWHGTALGSQHSFGTQWAVLEYMVNGQRYQNDVPGIIIPATAGTYFFDVTIFVPFTSSRVGDLEHQTSQLALLARASQLQINVAPTSVLTGLSGGASAITQFTARCSAILEPRQELVLGTPIETILTQIVAGAGNSVKITNFGTDTQLQGVDPGGGVLALNFLTALNGQGGSFSGNNILDFVWQWRGQQYTQDMLGLLSAWKRLLPVPYAGSLKTFDTPANALLQGIPYSLANATLLESVARSRLFNLLFWSLVLNGPRPRLSSLQTADSDQTFNLTVNGGYTGTHMILGQYARSFQKQMRDNWLAQVFAGGGGSLAAYVLGTGYGSAKLAQRGAPGSAFTTVDQARYLPWQLFPTVAASR